MMDLFRRELAPISDRGWDEIDETVRDTLRTNLGCRRVVDVSGPHGLDTAGVALGRLDVPEESDTDEVSMGVHRIQPMVEARVHFDLRLNELDQVSRGCRDVDLGPAEAAARLMAGFEDRLILNGLADGKLPGLSKVRELAPVSIGECASAEVLEGIAHALLQLRDAGVGGPYVLLAGPDLLKTLASVVVPGDLLLGHVEKIIGGGIVHSPELTGGVLVSRRGGDLELTLGQDLSVGYERHDTETVRLYITESLTFRVLDGRAVVRLSVED